MLFINCSISQTIGRSCIGVMGSSHSNEGLSITQTVGQASNTKSENNENLYLRQGFQQPIYIIEESNELNVSVFPNPTNGVFYVQINDVNIQEAFLTIQDQNGKILYEDKTSSNEKKQINLNNYSMGMYFLKIENNKKISTFMV